MAAFAGQTLKHRIQGGQGQAGWLRGREGPDGLKISADGKLTWPVPIDKSGEDVTVVVRVIDASGRAWSQNLMIRVN